MEYETFKALRQLLVAIEESADVQTCMERSNLLPVFDRANEAFHAYERKRFNTGPHA